MTMRSKCHFSPDNVATFGVLAIGVKVWFRFNTKAPRSSVLTKVSHEMASPEGSLPKFIGHFSSVWQVWHFLHCTLLERWQAQVEIVIARLLVSPASPEQERNGLVWRLHGAVGAHRLGLF